MNPGICPSLKGLWLWNHCHRHSLDLDISKLVFLHQIPTSAHLPTNMLRCHERHKPLANSPIFEALLFCLTHAWYDVGKIFLIHCCVCCANKHMCKKLAKMGGGEVQALVITRSFANNTIETKMKVISWLKAANLLLQLCVHQAGWLDSLLRDRNQSLRNRWSVIVF